VILLELFEAYLSGLARIDSQHRHSPARRLHEQVLKAEILSKQGVQLSAY